MTTQIAAEPQPDALVAQIDDAQRGRSAVGLSGARVRHRVQQHGLQGDALELHLEDVGDRSE
jgi:hypothetical protein